MTNTASYHCIQYLQKGSKTELSSAANVVHLPWKSYKIPLSWNSNINQFAINKDVQ
jgi:hypothetical protein